MGSTGLPTESPHGLCQAEEEFDSATESKRWSKWEMLSPQPCELESWSKCPPKQTTFHWVNRRPHSIERAISWLSYRYSNKCLARIHPYEAPPNSNNRQDNNTLLPHHYLPDHKAPYPQPHRALHPLTPLYLPIVLPRRPRHHHHRDHRLHS